MSHFYGTLEGNRGEATRCGTKASGIETYAASWSGAVRVHVYYDEDRKEDWARVSLVRWRGSGSEKLLYHGPVAGYPKTPGLIG